MRDILKISFLLIVLIFTYIYRDTIATFVTDKIIYRGSNQVLTYNEYYLENDYLYIKNTDINKVTSYQEILNILYTIVNSGDDSFSFYCDYDNCLKDMKNLTTEKDTVASINNFVHPYNSFDSINIDVGADGKITVKTKKVYSEREILFINQYIDEFINKNINLSMNNRDKIKVFHDHIVNNTIYDENNTFDSYTAYNLLTSGISICGGYSDIMAIYLNKIGIKNYKITSQNHIWNLVELDGAWYHLDVTWDDPVTNDGKQYLIHNFFLITTQKLLEIDKVEHNYNKNIYLEAN